MKDDVKREGETARVGTTKSAKISWTPPVLPASVRPGRDPDAVPDETRRERPGLGRDGRLTLPPRHSIREAAETVEHRAPVTVRMADSALFHLGASGRSARA